MKRRFTYSIILTAILICIVPAGLEAQCAMCKQAAETSLKSNPNSMARSLNAGILYLMAVPYLMILFIFRKQVVALCKSLVSRFGNRSAAR